MSGPTYYFELHGARIGFRASASDLEAVQEMLPTAAIGPCPSEAADLRWIDGQHAGHVLGSALRMAVAESSPDALFIHAGAVAVGGRGIVLPGPSGAGKSTLTEALMRRGAEYFCDEFAVIADHGLLHPLPSWLSLRRTDGEGFVDPRTLGAIGTAPVPVGVVALAEYGPGRSVEVDELAGGEAALAVLTHSLSLRTHPASAGRRAREVAAAARVVRL
jgi:hypothetical protein